MIETMRSTMNGPTVSLARLLDFGASVHGDTIVTSWNGPTPETTTFATIGARAGAFAHALHDDLGIEGDDRVATFMVNRAEHLEVLFAAGCSGAVFTPLNKQLLDTQLTRIINHCGAKVIVCGEELTEKLGRIVAHCPKVKHICVIGIEDPSHWKQYFPDHVTVWSYEALLDGKSTKYPWPKVNEHDACVICYSTGTTEGGPKGIAYSHRSIWMHSMGLRTTDSFAVSHGVPFLCCVPIYHVLSWGVPLAAFMCGCPLIFPGTDVSAPALAKIIATSHPRAATGVPTLWIQLMVYYANHPAERMSLQEIFAGGSPVPPVLIKLWEERFGVDVIHVWGMTETSPIGTVARPPSGVGGDQRWGYRISQGRFPASIQYRVMSDGEDVTGTDCNQGEIQVRGPWVTTSYWQPEGYEPDEIATSKFTADGWLCTGDVGSVTRDGFLTVEDRIRDVIRSGGEWIYSVQVENMVMDCREVVEAAVIGYPDDKWGERPLAVTVLYPHVEPTEETAERIRNKLRDRGLPGWMAPEYWTFVDQIDHTSVGKFDKKDLRRHLADNEFTIIKLPGPGER